MKINATKNTTGVGRTHETKCGSTPSPSGVELRSGRLQNRISLTGRGSKQTDLGHGCETLVNSS